MSAPLPDGHLTAIGAVFLVFQNLRAFVLQITGKQKDAWKRCLSMSTFISVNCFTITWKPLFQKLSIRFRSLCLSLSLYLSLSIALLFSFTFYFSVSLPLPLLPFFCFTSWLFFAAILFKTTVDRNWPYYAAAFCSVVKGQQTCVPSFVF